MTDIKELIELIEEIRLKECNKCRKNISKFMKKNNIEVKNTKDAIKKILEQMKPWRDDFSIPLNRKI